MSERLYQNPAGIPGSTIARAKAIQRATGKPFLKALAEARGSAIDAAVKRRSEQLFSEALAAQDAARATVSRTATTKAAIGQAQRIMAADSTVSFHEAMDRGRAAVSVSTHAPGSPAARAQEIMAGKRGMTFGEAMDTARDEATIARLNAQAKAAKQP